MLKLLHQRLKQQSSLFCNDTADTVTYSASGSVYTFFYNNTYNCYLEADKLILVVVYPKSISVISLTEQFSQQVDFTIGFVNFQIIYIIVITTPVGFSSSAILYNGQPITNWATYIQYIETNYLIISQLAFLPSHCSNNCNYFYTSSSYYI